MACPNILMTKDYSQRSFNFDLVNSIDIKIPDRTDWNNGSVVPSDCNVVWYSDGSVIDGHAGAGVFCSSLGIESSFSLGKFCTIFQAEVFALIKCAELSLERNVSNSKIFICSDSQAAIKAIANPMSESKLITECKNKLLELSDRSNSISLTWVPGHSSIDGNEIADKLAKNGADGLFTGPEPALGLSFNMYSTWLKESNRNEHIRLWNNTSGCRQAKRSSLRHLRPLNENQF